MTTKRVTSTTYFYLLSLTLLFLFMDSSTLLAVQQASKEAVDSGITSGDVFEFVLTAGYLVGVFILLPWVVYTNTKEKLSVNASGTGTTNIDLSEEERNDRTAMILDEIEKKLSPFQEEGQDLVTITKGSQARFVKKGIDYIQQNLQPTDSDLISRVEEFIGVYEDRTKRFFTGSKWIIGCSIGTGIFFTYMAGISTFIFIHFLGLVFYFLSSRTPLYILEKRMKLFGGGNSMFGAIFSGLFIGAGAKHYNIYSDGRKERDYSSEFTGGAVFFLIIIVVAMFLGFLAAALGVVNFLMNYMNNALIPEKPESWYTKNFAQN